MISDEKENKNKMEVDLSARGQQVCKMKKCRWTSIIPAGGPLGDWRQVAERSGRVPRL